MKTPQSSRTALPFILMAGLLSAAPQESQKALPPSDDPRLASLKVEAAAEVDRMAPFTQQMVDRNVQTRDVKYTPFLTADDRPAIWLNRKIMDRFLLEMRRYYYDPSKYKTYLEQLGIKYPTIRN